MNRLYPIFLKLAGRSCVVVGGGAVAFQKVEQLLVAEATVAVVSPEVSEPMRALIDAGRVMWVRREYREGDLAGATLAFSAVDDRAVSARVLEEARARGILLNAADFDPHCDFHVPATATSGDVKVAVSTGGKSPALASEIKQRIVEWLDERWARFAAALGELRPRVLERWPLDPERRKRVLCALAHSVRPSFPDRAVWCAAQGKVHLVGAGPGNPGLLTLKALALLRSADLVLFDRLVGPEVLSLIPTDTPRVYVGKDVGHDRADTARLAIEAARAGKAVVRLKGGDPFLFGRGGEEMLALIEAGVPFEVVPGVSALNGVPAAAGIPLTLRGVAHEVVVRTGATAN